MLLCFFFFFYKTERKNRNNAIWQCCAFTDHIFVSELAEYFVFVTLGEEKEELKGMASCQMLYYARCESQNWRELC